MQLGTAADDFLTGRRQLKMMTKVKVGGSDSTQVSKPRTTKATTRRTSGTVVSANRSTTDIFVDDDELAPELSRKAIAIDDIYDFGSSPPRSAASTPVQRPNSRKMTSEQSR